MNVKAGMVGALAGLAGVAAMTGLEYLKETMSDRPTIRPVRELSERGGRHDTEQSKKRADETGLPQVDATVRVAQNVTRKLFGRELPTKDAHLAGVGVHVGIAMISGAAYGLLAGRRKKVDVGLGVTLGAAIWLFVEEIGLPLARLTGPPSSYSLSEHANGLLTHLGFGLVTETARGLMMKRL